MEGLLGGIRHFIEWMGMDGEVSEFFNKNGSETKISDVTVAV